MNDASKDFIIGIKSKDTVLLETIEEKHDSITKFVSYCLRLLTKGNIKDQKDKLVLYHIISNLDKITDVLKYTARDIINLDNKLKKETINLLEVIFESIDKYYSLFYKFDFKKSSNLYETRSEYLITIKSLLTKLPANEILILEKSAALLELVTDLSEARMALNND